MVEEVRRTVIGWDYSAEYLEVEPTPEDEMPLPVLCIKEQFTVNGEPNGKANYYQVGDEIKYKPEAVNKAMQVLADSNKRMLAAIRARMAGR